MCSGYSELLKWHVIFNFVNTDFVGFLKIIKICSFNIRHVTGRNILAANTIMRWELPRWIGSYSKQRRNWRHWNNNVYTTSENSSERADFWAALTTVITGSSIIRTAWRGEGSNWRNWSYARYIRVENNTPCWDKPVLCKIKTNVLKRSRLAGKIITLRKTLHCLSPIIVKWDIQKSLKLLYQNKSLNSIK